MFALLAFIIGLVIFFKGGFQLSNRTITREQSRSIALILMAPLVVVFCASTVIVMNTPNIIQWSADGSSFTVNQSQSVMDYIGNTTGVVELLAVGLAIVLVMYRIYGNPPGRSAPATTPQRSQASAAPPTPSATPPNILTVAEAAAYMRITEKEVLGLIDQGKLGAARIGDSYRIARIAIENFMTGS